MLVDQTPQLGHAQRNCGVEIVRVLTIQHSPTINESYKKIRYKCGILSEFLCLDPSPKTFGAAGIVFSGVSSVHP